VGEYVFGFIKITSRKKYANDLMRGKIFCNRLKYYMDLEEKEIGDSKDSTTAIIRLRTSLLLGNRLNTYSLLFQDTEAQLNPVFCMYTILNKGKRLTLTANIGSLKDITECCNLEELFSGKDVKFTIDWNFNKTTILNR